MPPSCESLTSHLEESSTFTELKNFSQLQLDDGDPSNFDFLSLDLEHFFNAPDFSVVPVEPSIGMMESVMIHAAPLVSKSKEELVTPPISVVSSPLCLPDHQVSSGTEEDDIYRDFQETVKQLEEDAADGPHDLVTATKPSQKKKLRGRPKRSTDYCTSHTNSTPSGTRAASLGLRERASLNYAAPQVSDEEEDDDDDEDGSSGSEQHKSSSKRMTSEFMPHVKHFDQLSEEDIANIDFKQLTRLMKEARLSVEQMLEIKATRRKLKNRFSARVCSNKKRETCSSLAATNNLLSTKTEELEQINYLLKKENTSLKDRNVVLSVENMKMKRQIEDLLVQLTIATSNQGCAFDLEKPLTPS